mmetsp:Transcript_26710/g.58071  ORF Transcript_26710/g.58071 Transcript_26710/m.58071 type:complete len:87 (+) Transcript_26710:923-1183(+)
MGRPSTKSCFEGSEGVGVEAAAAAAEAPGAVIAVPMDIEAVAAASWLIESPMWGIVMPICMASGEAAAPMYAAAAAWGDCPPDMSE